MPEEKEHLKKVEKKIANMVKAIYEGEGDLNSAKLVGFFINKKGLSNHPALLKQILPKIVKILIDFGDIPLCIQVMEEAINCFPEDDKLKQRIKKLKELDNLNTVHVKKTKEKDESISSYDLESEITNLDNLLKDKPPFNTDTNIQNELDPSCQVTKISTGITNLEIIDSNERTLVPTPSPYDITGVNKSKTSYGYTKITPAAQTPNLPMDIIANYPGLTLLSARYEYSKMLGEGGMGGVFLATDRQLERNVAIKFMNSACISNPEVAERFIREARAQAVASHPGIVSIYDVGTEGNPFIVMEYIEGKTIKDVIKKEGGFSLKESIKLMLLVAEALEYAHFKKIIHRDVKPDNIILDQFGKTRLLDFGLAKLEQTPSMTINNQIMGTPYYMSPEQIKGDEVGPPTDIYAWGVMFYQMVTGLLPFSKGDILYHHVNSLPIPPKSLTMDIPDALNKVILKSMEKEVSNRYQNFKETISDLQEITL